VGGKENAGVVTFHRIDDDTTRVMVQMDWAPQGIKEKLGNALGFPDRRVEGDLERFKDFIESRGRSGDRRVARRGAAERLTEPRSSATDNAAEPARHAAPADVRAGVRRVACGRSVRFECVHVRSRAASRCRALSRKDVGEQSDQSRGA
jgi:hypothetical protein